MKQILVQKIVLSFPELKIREFDIPKFRGYLANRYRDYHLIHNHLPGGKFHYHYPVIQFKVLNDAPTIIGLEDGIAILKKVFIDIAHLEINGKQHRINEKAVVLNCDPLGQSTTPFKYRFVLPWMPLNQENFVRYKAAPWAERRSILESILVGNLISLAKGLHYDIPAKNDLRVESHLTPKMRNFKNNRMLCFEGEFSVNFLIPDYMGLGKQTARGFGTVVRIHNERNELNEKSL